MEPRERIEQVGFRRVGGWSLESGQPVCLLQTNAKTCNVLYAFVSGPEVLYLGKTTRELRQRMHGYQRPGPSQRTNIAGKANIVKVLTSRRPVDIYALCGSETMRHGDVIVNLAAGLEDSLIRELKPSWNKVGK